MNINIMVYFASVLMHVAGREHVRPLMYLQPLLTFLISLGLGFCLARVNHALLHNPQRGIRILAITILVLSTLVMVLLSIGAGITLIVNFRAGLDWLNCLLIAFVVFELFVVAVLNISALVCLSRFKPDLNLPPPHAAWHRYFRNVAHSGAYLAGLIFFMAYAPPAFRAIFSNAHASLPTMAEAVLALCEMLTRESLWPIYFIIPLLGGITLPLFALKLDLNRNADDKPGLGRRFLGWLSLGMWIFPCAVFAITLGVPLIKLLFAVQQHP